VEVFCDFINNCSTDVYTILPKLKGTKNCISEKGQIVELYRHCVLDVLSIWDSMVVNNSKSTLDNPNGCQLSVLVDVCYVNRTKSVIKRKQSKAWFCFAERERII
jgi:hypothetical protein